MKPNYERTIKACLAAYIVQAITNNYVPLLFLTFHRSYGIPMGQITFLITMNFGIQLLVDLLSALFVDKLGYRFCMVGAHVLCAAGLILLTALPEILPNAFVGIMLAVVVYAVGGGLLEVLVSPVVESCPSPNKEKTMSLLHSFYCWGEVGVVLISTVFFQIAGTQNWKILALLWTILPIANCLVFTKVPMTSLIAEGEKGMTIGELLGQKVFWVLLVLMTCAGASEQGVSQWASTFAEEGLGVSKTVGDLAGPMAFAVLMGTARAIYGKYGDRIDLDRFMTGSGILCVIAYLTISLVPSPVVSLVACAVCGFSVGIMWPGSFSKASAMLPRGGTVMFAFLALAGDIGCSGGPTIVGMVSSALGDNLKRGMLAGVAFPAILLIGLFLCGRLAPKKKRA